MVRSGASHDVAFDIAAGAQRAQQTGVDPRNGFLQIAFQDAMKLNPLARRETKGAVGISAGQLVHGEILLGGEPAAGNFATHHEHVVLAHAVLLAVLAGVAILLLVGAVEFEQLLVGFAKVIRVRCQFLGNRAAKLPARFFRSFDRR